MTIREGSRVEVRPGEIFRSGGKLYGICGRCYGVVRLDKPIVGDLHFCRDPEPTDRERGETDG